MSAQTQPNLPPLPVEDRRPYLDAYVANKVARFGARAEQLSPTSVQLTYGKRVNHILHLLLTLVTAGLWGLVWIVLALSGGESRRVATVDPWGRVTEV